jgi:hypothetical protein
MDKNLTQIKIIAHRVKKENIAIQVVIIFARCVLQDFSPVENEMIVLNVRRVCTVIQSEEYCAPHVSQ